MVGVDYKGATLGKSETAARRASGIGSEPTSNPSSPLVSIGIPVYNGENYLAEAIDSILSQTLGDLEVIISDNASTDRTAEICEMYASRDPRVRYVRQSANLGAAPNYNAVFHESRGRYFKWAAHDDVCDPVFLERCVASLESDVSCVVAYPRKYLIDEEGNRLSAGGTALGLESPSVDVRVEETLFRTGIDGAPVPVFGVMRRSALITTRLHGSYTGSDRTLIAEMALIGRFSEVDEFLFLERDHPDRSIRIPKKPGNRSFVREAWFDTSRAGKIVFPNWRRLGELASAITRAPIPWSLKMRCYGVLARWVSGQNTKRLAMDIQRAIMTALRL